jgi:hypothetical protein
MTHRAAARWARAKLADSIGGDADNRNENSFAGAQYCPVRPSGKPRDGERHGRFSAGGSCRRTPLIRVWQKARACNLGGPPQQDMSEV